MTQLYIYDMVCWPFSNAASRPPASAYSYRCACCVTFIRHAETISMEARYALRAASAHRFCPARIPAMPQGIGLRAVSVFAYESALIGTPYPSARRASTHFASRAFQFINTQEGQMEILLSPLYIYFCAQARELPPTTKNHARVDRLHRCPHFRRRDMGI